MRNKTILQILPALETGGIERVTIQTTKQLIALSPENTFLVASKGGRLASELGDHHIEIPGIHQKMPWNLIINVVRLVQLIRTRMIDCVHVRSRAPAWAAYIACKFTGTPFMTSFHGVYNQGNFLKAFYNSVMVRGVRVIAISEFIAKHIHQKFAYLNPQVACIPAGINVHHFDPQTVSNNEIDAFYASLNISRQRKILFLPGRLSKWKGQHVLLEAAQNLDQDRYVIVIAGDHQGRVAYADHLKTLADKLSMPVVFVNSVDDLKIAYAASFVVFSCSTDPEAFGRITTEALAMGKPYIATNHGGSIEQTRSGRYGMLVPPSDIDALVKAIHEYEKQSPEDLQKYAKEARTHIVMHYAEDRMAQMTLNVYQGIFA